MAEEVGDSVCIIDSPNQSPNDGRRATFDFAALQLVRWNLIPMFTLSLRHHYKSVELRQITDNILKSGVI